MAINAQQVLSNLTNPSLNSIEQLMLDYFESYYDKEITVKFTGVNIMFNLLDTFTTPLRKSNINPGRDTIIYNQLVALYTTAGWTVTQQSYPTGMQIIFTPTPL